MVTAHGTTCRQRSIETTLAGLADATLGAPSGRPSPAGAGAQTGPLVVTIGRTVANRARLNWWESRALYGWTVLVPRTKDQAGEMRELLRVHGALPKRVPTVAVEPPRTPAQMERAVKGLVDGRYQWVVFTSTNSVRALWEKFTEFGLDARAFSGVRIACVARPPAIAVRALGIIPELIPPASSRRGLLASFPDYDDVLDPVDRVLLPRADIATETLAEGLRERGWEIDDVTAYRTVRAAPPAAPIREAIKTGGFDAVLLHLVLDRAEPGRHRRQAAPTIDRRLPRAEDRRDRARSSGCGSTCSRRSPRSGADRGAGRTRHPAAGRGRPAAAA